MATVIRLEDLPDYNSVPQKTIEEIRQENINYLRDEEGIEITGGAEDPLYRIVNALSYREKIWRHDKNEADRNKLMAYAEGDAQDHIGVTYHRTPRLENESNEAYRKRLEIAPEGITVAGTVGAYRFHTLSAHADVKDVIINKMLAGQLQVVVLSHQGSGVASQELIDQVDAALNPDDIRPLNDTPLVGTAAIAEYSVTATLRSLTDITNEQQAQALSALQTYVDEQHGLNKNVVRSGIDRALHQNGIDEVVLDGWVDVITDAVTAPYCTAINLSVEKIGAV
ncbi:hypothetical protein AB835_11665 [Candidatus Endobugula sertula]|uniref:Baseplate J-like central domain-containing protein n=1 Tax=Candidatus Endobugula sertula TaxID=62101 RepID=A0A1D2QMV6_9GAMM|nr:hypothetical protein AB835_11665 [Candidatus Endobugula sertula]